MDELVREVARLADAVEALERARHARQLNAEWARPLTPVGIGLLLEAVPGLAAKFDHVVPPEFVALSPGGLEVACPCGDTPVVAAGGLTGCSCGRWFLNDGHDVHVALSPAPPAAAATS